MSTALKQKFAAIVSAQEGFFILEPMLNDEGLPVDACRHPIIGWAIDADAYCTYPITLEGIKDEWSLYILQPDGSVDRPNADWHPNFDEWMKYMQHEYHIARESK